MRSSFSDPPVSSRWQSPEKHTDLTMCLCSNLYSSSPVMAFHSRAEKSALAVAACVAGAFRVAPHTHPLCPSNVPIQSPVSPLRIMGWPSETR